MDREKVIHAVETAFELWIDEYTGCSWFKEDEVRQAKEDALALMKDQPKVVRCKDCIHWEEGSTEECDNSDSVCFHNGRCKPYWFCADGEMKE